MRFSLRDLISRILSPCEDQVIVSDTIDITDGSDSPFVAISAGQGTVTHPHCRNIVDGSLGGTVDTSDAVVVAGIENSGRLATGREQDSVAGSVSFAVGIDSPLEAFGIRNGPGGLIDTGAGMDSVCGHAELKAPDYTTGSINGVDFPSPEGRLAAIGIDGGAINTARGADEIVGAAEVISGAEDLPVTAIGLNDVAVSTGSGDDRVEGKAFVQPGEAAPNTVIGILDGAIDTGRGSDTIAGTAEFHNTLLSGNFSDLALAGIKGTEITTGGGSDDVSGTLDMQGQSSWDLQGSAAIKDAAISTSHGADTVAGRLSLSIVFEANADGLAGIGDTEIDTGKGDDVVSGEVDMALGTQSSTDDNAGIRASRIATGDGADIVSGKISQVIRAASYAEATNGISDSVIDTGRGDDIVEGTSMIEADDVYEASGDGIHNAIINTGRGADRVIGTAETTGGMATPTEETHSDGIQGGMIDLGSGDDTVIARGTTAGVRDVDIFGGSGNDLFDLHSGTGMIDGGTGWDRLILAGDSGDFLFEDTGSETGRITGGETDLTVANLEQIEFDDGTFISDMLFA